MDQPRSNFDVTSEPNPTTPRAGDQPAVRPFLGIRFKCCRTYGRIYRNDEKTAYSGQCPKCRAKVSVPIGQGGTSSRFFDAG